MAEKVVFVMIPPLGLIFLEDFCVPVPGETVLIIAAVYAGTGRLNVWLVALVGFVAAVLGDNVGFGIGHFGGRPLAERYGKYIFLTPERLDKTASFFDRHGGKVIVIARFVEGLRQANGIIAGITGMHWTKFLPFNMRRNARREPVRQRLDQHDVFDAEVVPRLSDEELVPFTGPPGTMTFIDTSTCLHFGSRLAPGAAERLVVQFQYLTPPAFDLWFRRRARRPFGAAVERLTPLQRSVLRLRG